VCFQQQSKRTLISGLILQGKALQFFSQFYPESEINCFKGSTGWVAKFLSRHDKRSISLPGEALSAKASSVDDSRKEFREFIEREG